MRPWPWQQREAGVSDVLGSVLLVGITVLMAAGFGAMLLSYDGPVNETHTQLEVRIWSGADLDYGPNDAELLIRHLGGEAIRSAQTTVIYTEVGGQTQSLHPAFAGNRLKIGQTWTQTISAFPGDVIPVTIVVTSPGGEVSGSSVISTGDVPAGGATTVVLTYVATNTPTKGIVANFGNAQAANDNAAAATLTEDSVTPVSTTTTYTPTTATVSGTGASNPNNAKTSDNAYATLRDLNDRVQGEGFSIGSPYAVTAVTMGMEAKGTTGLQAVTLVTTQTGSSGAVGASSPVQNVGSVATASFAANGALVYTAFVAHGDSLNPDVAVSTVTGLGLTWTRVQTISTPASASGRGHLELWVASGTPSGTTAVTATFAAAVEDAIIEVNGWSGVDTAAPIQASVTAVSGGATAIATTAIAGTATYGRFVVGANVVAAATGIYTSPATNLAEVDKDEAHLSVAHGAAAASNTGTGVAAVSVRWTAIAFTLKPAIIAVPTVRLSYHLTPSAVAGTTTITPTVTATDADYTVAITGDRTWLPADFSTLSIRATVTAAPTTGAGGLAPTIDVDRVYVTVTTTSGPTTYTLDVQLDWPTPAQVPTTGTTYLQVQYTTSVDTFTVEARSGTSPSYVWRSCGTLSSASPSTFTTFTCLLTTAEHSNGVPVIRIRDVNTASTSAGILSIDYARVSST